MSLRSGLSILLERHAQALLGSLGRLARQPLATLLTVLVIGIALALPAALYLAVANMRTVTRGLDDTVQLSVYFRMSTTEAEARKATAVIAARHGIAETKLVSPDEGLAEFQKLSGIGDALKALPDNPLPWLLRCGPRRRRIPPRRSSRWRRSFARWTGWTSSRPDTAWVRRLHAIEDTMQQLVLLVAAVLAAGVLAVVGNTIRLEINGRRAEIEVTKLVGGSNAFVRRPFLYSGLWQGLLPAACSRAGLVTLGLMVLEPVRREARRRLWLVVRTAGALDDGMAAGRRQRRCTRFPGGLAGGAPTTCAESRPRA